MKSTFVVPDDLTPAVRAAGAPEPGDPILPHNPLCFGCGPDSPNGLHLRLVAGPGMSATGEMFVEQHFEGGPGTIHGGVLSSAFDEMMGLNVVLMRLTAVTAVLNVDFALPIQLGSRLQFDAEILGVQRRKIYTRATAHLIEADGSAGAQVAGAHGLFVIVDPSAHYRDSRTKSQMAPGTVAP